MSRHDRLVSTGDKQMSEDQVQPTAEEQTPDPTVTATEEAAAPETEAAATGDTSTENSSDQAASEAPPTIEPVGDNSPPSDIGPYPDPSQSPGASTPSAEPLQDTVEKAEDVVQDVDGIYEDAMKELSDLKAARIPLIQAILDHAREHNQKLQAVHDQEKTHKETLLGWLEKKL